MIKIKEMELEDFNNIKDSLEEKFDDFWNPNVLKSELENPNSKYICAYEEDELIAFSGILISPDIVEITNIVVRKDKRRKGYGREILSKLLEYAKETKREKINLEVNSENQAAINLYKSFGFEEIYVRKKYYNNKFDAIIMSKNI